MIFVQVCRVHVGRPGLSNGVSPSLQRSWNEGSLRLTRCLHHDVEMERFRLHVRFATHLRSGCLLEAIGIHKCSFHVHAFHFYCESYSGCVLLPHPGSLSQGFWGRLSLSSWYISGLSGACCGHQSDALLIPNLLLWRNPVFAASVDADLIATCQTPTTPSSYCTGFLARLQGQVC